MPSKSVVQPLSGLAAATAEEENAPSQSRRRAREAEARPRAPSESSYRMKLLSHCKSNKSGEESVVDSLKVKRFFDSILRWDQFSIRVVFVWTDDETRCVDSVLDCARENSEEGLSSDPRLYPLLRCIIRNHGVQSQCSVHCTEIFHQICT